MSSLCSCVAHQRKMSWPFGSRKAEKAPIREEHLVKISDLPIYPESERLSSFQFVEDGPIPMQQSLSGFRSCLQLNYRKFMGHYTSAERFVTNTGESAKQVNNYVREEGTVIPKAIAITLGGMTGFLFGMQRGASLTRAFYSSLGMVTMAAFCYPNETVDLSRSTLDGAQRQWTQFKTPPTPPPPPVEKVYTDESESFKPSPDIDMYTTRSTRIS